MLGDTVTVTYTNVDRERGSQHGKSRGVQSEERGYRERELSAPASRAGRSEHCTKLPQWSAREQLYI